MVSDVGTVTCIFPPFGVAPATGDQVAPGATEVLDSRAKPVAAAGQLMVMAVAVRETVMVGRSVGVPSGPAANDTATRSAVISPEYNRNSLYEPAQ